MPRSESFPEVESTPLRPIVTSKKTKRKKKGGVPRGSLGKVVADRRSDHDAGMRMAGTSNGNSMGLSNPNAFDFKP